MDNCIGSAEKPKTRLAVVGVVGVAMLQVLEAVHEEVTQIEVVMLLIKVASRVQLVLGERLLEDIFRAVARL